MKRGARLHPRQWQPGSLLLDRNPDAVAVQPLADMRWSHVHANWRGYIAALERNAQIGTTMVIGIPCASMAAHTR